VRGRARTSAGVERGAAIAAATLSAPAGAFKAGWLEVAARQGPPTLQGGVPRPTEPHRPPAIHRPSGGTATMSENRTTLPTSPNAKNRANGNRSVPATMEVR
jgi:hypothetical protein